MSQRSPASGVARMRTKLTRAEGGGVRGASTPIILPMIESVEPTTERRAPRRARPRLLSVVAPAYNEAEGLPKFVEEVRCVLPPLADDFEILIVDDGSRDTSREVLSKLQLVEPRL